MDFEKLNEIIKTFKGTRFTVHDVITRYNLNNLKNQIEENLRTIIVVASVITTITGIKSRLLSVNGKPKKAYDWK